MTETLVLNTHPLHLPYLVPHPHDKSRTVELAADAVRAARALLSLRQGLNSRAASFCAPALDGLAQHVTARDLLNDNARDTLADLVSVLELLLADQGEDSVIEAMLMQANLALEASHRVADLVTAAAGVTRLETEANPKKTSD